MSTVPTHQKRPQNLCTAPGCGRPAAYLMPGDEWLCPRHIDGAEGYVCTGEDVFTKAGRTGCGAESPTSADPRDRRELAIAAGWLLWRSKAFGGGTLRDAGAALCPSCALAPARRPLAPSDEATPLADEL